MAILAGFRPFQRWNDGIQIQLRFDDWPADVPLPAGSTVVGIGENHHVLVHPYCLFILEPDKTVEFLYGWFVIPPSLDEAIAWYQAEMAKRGWVERSDKSYRMPLSAAVHFRHPETDARIVIGLQTWTHRNETTAMIRRVVEHPWAPVEEQLTKVEEALPIEGEEALAREEGVPVAV